MKIKTSELIGAVDLTDTVCKALRRSWHLGQTYWQQADSESFAQNKKAETTHAAFVALLDDTRAALAAAPAQPAAQQGAAYAALPTHSRTGRVYEEGFLIGRSLLYTADQMRAFADATHALRVAPHGQAPAQAMPAAVAGPSGYGPNVTVRRSCSDCKACNSESYAVQGDSGHYVYCEHPSLPESKYIGDTNWNTPHWCPVSAPTTQPASQQEAQEPAAVVVTCHTPSGKRVALYSAKQDLPIGTQLYTASAMWSPSMTNECKELVAKGRARLDGKS